MWFLFSHHIFAIFVKCGNCCILNNLCQWHYVCAITPVYKWKWLDMIMYWQKTEDYYSCKWLFFCDWTHVHASNIFHGLAVFWQVVSICCEDLLCNFWANLVGKCLVLNCLCAKLANVCLFCVCSQGYQRLFTWNESEIAN